MNIPDWYTKEVELSQDEDISKLEYSDYIESALEHGAYLVDVSCCWYKCLLTVQGHSYLGGRQDTGLSILL